MQSAREFLHRVFNELRGSGVGAILTKTALFEACLQITPSPRVGSESQKPEVGSCFSLQGFTSSPVKWGSSQAVASMWLVFAVYFRQIAKL